MYSTFIRHRHGYSKILLLHVNYLIPLNKLVIEICHFLWWHIIVKQKLWFLMFIKFLSYFGIFQFIDLNELNSLQNYIPVCYFVILKYFLSKFILNKRNSFLLFGKNGIFTGFSFYLIITFVFHPSKYLHVVFKFTVVTGIYFMNL